MKRSNSYSRSPINKKTKLRSHRLSDNINSECNSRREHIREKRDTRRNGKNSPRKQRRVRSNSITSHRRRHREKNENGSSHRRNNSRNSDSDNDFQTISVSNLNDRISDEEVRDVMYKEFNQYDKFTVKVTSGNGIPRVVYIHFRCPGDARHARKSKSRLKLFGLTVRVDPIYGSIQKRRTSPAPVAQTIQPLMANFMHPSMYQSPPTYSSGHEMPSNQIFDSDIVEQTRTIMVTGLESAIGQSDVHAIFANFGAIENVTLRRDRDRTAAYVTYYSVDMSRTAKIEMSGRAIGAYRCRAAYAKSPATNCLWIGGLGNFVTGERLEQELDRFAVIRRIEWPPDTLFAYVLFDCVDAASAALTGIRGVLFRGHQLRVDFVNPLNVEILRPYVNELRRNTSGATSATGQNSRSRPRTRERRQEAPPRRSHQEPPSRVREANQRRANRRRSPRPLARNRDNKPIAVDVNGGGSGSRGSERHPISGSGGRSRGDSKESGERASSADEDTEEEERRRISPVRPPSPPSSPEQIVATVESVRTLAELAPLLPVAWSGVIALKSSDFGAMMHLIAGSVDVVDNLMRDHTTTEMARVRITQRLRLDDSKLGDIERRIAGAAADCLSILLAVPTGVRGSSGDSATKPLGHLVDYLRNKRAAGVVAVDPKHVGSIIHTFPPCRFADRLISERAKCIRLNPDVDNYIVVVVIKNDSKS